jgi:hypothetical protein
MSGKIEKILESQLRPERNYGPKSAWVKTWSKVVIVDAIDL